MLTALSNMHIDADESQLLIEGFPSIGILIRASRGLLEERSPVDISTISKIAGFFDALDERI